MPSGLRRYEFSEQLARILGESHRDLRFRVTMMVSGGVVEAGPRGRGSPLATPAYGANLLIGAMAAPQQVHTVEAIRCYRELVPIAHSDTGAPGVVMGAPAMRVTDESAIASSSPTPPVSLSLALPLEELSFGECLTRLLSLSLFDSTRELLANELFGIWVNRSCPVAALQIVNWSEGRRGIITQRFEMPARGCLPAWIAPDRGGIADPGLFHTVFLPVAKLIEIGRLTTLEQKGIPMLSGINITKFAQLLELARQGRYRQDWEKLLSALARVQAWTNKIATEDSRLKEVTEFGSNPGNLRMFTYVPDNLPTAAPLVVALHGCTQTAAAYDEGTGWSQLADRFGFSLVFPQQHWSNNPLRCFNWFRSEDTTRDSGESLSIRQMVETLIRDHGLDKRRVYVTGLSSGAAMTSVMLATYPDLFAGGAIVAGVPYGAAQGLQEAFESMFSGRSLSDREWGDRVRSASAHRGPWPRVSVWHGDADNAVKPGNAEEIIKQWRDVHGLSSVPTLEEQRNGYPYRAWRDPRGESVLESYTITGMSHGQPLDTRAGEYACGTAAPFFNDVGISSTYRIAQFWGLPEAISETTQKAKDASQAKSKATGPNERFRQPSPALIPIGASPYDSAHDSAQGNTRVGEEPASHARDDEAYAQGKTRDSHGGGADALGIDVQGIIGKSLGLAGGILKGVAGGLDPNTKSGVKSGAKSTEKGDLFGIDVPGIIGKSLEMAGALAESYQAPKTDNLGQSEWRGEGWELIPHSANGSEPLLFGYASSGNDCDIGNKVRSISREVVLGRNPTLSYLRRLHLNATANHYTKACFSVLVDGLPVDEVSATGMKHTETEWTQCADIDLAPFAERAITLTFQVSAHANVCNEVFAKAWVDRVHVRDMVTVEGV
uniref:Esterase, PHB depolymerase family n=1 Tax=Candidatus Kentrum sp. MB TaxID=2138164 RepID=A0A450XG91_9GAMM|nr:MAG: esterase, PHB depolymerase family [Candidatus Kentron sp. MB]VFK32550.1 MAG: esterase, PHB depolymerase family [Candidatus Kentron sp. MB]VFK75974.1 MAG: esterase, PHB depolymerase family [Candidatus Kentron sp. MB]